jgi:hypothetical protein
MAVSGPSRPGAPSACPLDNSKKRCAQGLAFWLPSPGGWGGLE